LLLAELLVARQALRSQLPGLDRRAYGAAGLLAMRAVAEAAVRAKTFDVGKGGGECFAGFPELQLPHARRVDEEAAGREHDELACRARVPAATVRLAHFPGGQQRAADQLVGDTRLPHARRPEERGCPAETQVSFQDPQRLR